MKTLIKPIHPVQPVKTIETMFRITSSNSQKLSDQADKKSNLMITVNAVVASVMITYMSGALSQKSAASLPLILLLVVNILTITFSILATRPCIPNGHFTKKDMLDKKVNLLFFGNFYRMPFNEYCDGMQQVIHNESWLHHSLLQDLFCQGVVLGRKYKMLKIAYTIFLWGIIISIAGFILTIKLNTGV